MESSTTLSSVLLSFGFGWKLSKVFAFDSPKKPDFGSAGPALVNVFVDWAASVSKLKTESSLNGISLFEIFVSVADVFDVFAVVVTRPAKLRPLSLKGDEFSVLMFCVEVGLAKLNFDILDVDKGAIVEEPKIDVVPNLFDSVMLMK